MASQSARRTRVDILGVGVSVTSMDATLREIAGWIERREQHYVCVTNVHAVMEAQRDRELTLILNESGLSVPDGAPIFWAGRLAGAKDMGRVRGPDLLPAVCALAAKRGWSSFFYGAAPGTPERLAERLVEQFPALKVAGTYSPPFRPLTLEEDAEVVARINESGADLLWVGLSTPKQECWMSEHVGRVQTPVLLGVGAAFDIHAGIKPQAPRWMRPLGLEWVYRLALEPRRLWRRYLETNPRFVASILRHPPFLRPERRVDVSPSVVSRGSRNKSTEEPPMLSVITPAFNASRFLPENIESVASLTVPYEHIVVDGGSTDGTVALLRAQRDPRLRWISEPDRGQTHAVNKGLGMSRGEFVGWLNADDAYVPDAIDRAVAILRAQRDIDAVFGFMEVIDEEGRSLRTFRSGPFSWWRYLYAGDYLPTPTIIFRRALLGRAPRLDDAYADAADYDFYLRLLRGANVRRLRTPLVRFRYHPGSKTASRVEVQLREAMAIRLGWARTPVERSLMRGTERVYRLRNRLIPPWPEIEEHAQQAAQHAGPRGTG